MKVEIGMMAVVMLAATVNAEHPVFGKWHDSHPVPDAHTEATALPDPATVGMTRTGLLGLEVDVLEIATIARTYQRPTRTVYYERLVSWNEAGQQYASDGQLDSGSYTEAFEAEVELSRWESVKAFAKERPVITTTSLLASGAAIVWAGDKYLWGGGGSSKGSDDRKDSPDGASVLTVDISGDNNTVIIVNNQPQGSGTGTENNANTGSGGQQSGMGE